MAFTYFFRDRHTLDLIAEHVIPVLKRHTYINIWDAGCASGPEPYSLAMLLRENMGPFMFRNVRIYATDLEAQFGEIIHQGIYPESRVKRIPPAYLETYFTPLSTLDDSNGANGSEQNYQISREMRNAIRFRHHDLLTDGPPRTGFGLILCKNVLLHLPPARRIDVLETFYAALSDDGYLVTEQTQKLPSEVRPLFNRVTSSGQVFRKSAPTASTSDAPLRMHRPGGIESGGIEREGREGRERRERRERREGEVTVAFDAAFSSVSDYVWVNIEVGEERVGKARVALQGQRLTVYSISIFPAFQRQGYARQTVHLFQAQYDEIVADRVRYQARPFWQEMGFREDANRNYVWKE